MPRVRLVDERGEMVGRRHAQRSARTWPPRPGSTSSRSRPTPIRRSARSSISASSNTRNRRSKNEARKKQKVIEVKEIKLRPGIDDHDYDVKMRSMIKFIEEGDKVKVTMRFRGRELAHQELGMNVLMRVQRRSRRDRQGRAVSRAWKAAR